MAEIDYSQMTSNMYAPWMQNLLLPADQQVNYFGNITTDIGTNLKTGLDEFFAENPAPSMEYKYPSLEELGLAGTTGAGAPLYGSYPRGINNYIGSLAGKDLINKLPYQEDPRYADAYKRYTTLTGGNPDFYKTVSDLDTMTNLDWALNDMARARMDYTNGVLGGGGVLPQNQESEYFDRINNYGVKATPIGMINGTVIYSNTGDRPTDSGFYYLDGRDIMYQPEVQDDHWYDSGPLRAVAAVATGGLSELTTGGSVTDKIGSVMSGGLSVANEEAMGAIADKIGLDESSTQFLKDVTGQFVPGAGLDTRQILEGIEKGSDQGFWAGLDRAVDPAGTIDYTTRKQGDLQNELVPELRQYYQPAGAIIGNIVWGPYGAAIGSGLGSKMAGGTEYYDYGEDFKNAGMAFLASDLTSGIDTGISNAVSPTIGTTAGNIAGGVVKGATAGALNATPNAVKTGDYDALLQNAALGGLIGGIASGAGELYNYFNPPNTANLAADQYYIDRYLQQNPSPYYDTITGQMVYPQSLSYDELLSKAYQSANPGFTPFTVDPTLQYITPADTALQGTIENSIALGNTNAEQLSDQYYIDRYLQQNPSPYYDPITQQMITPSPLTPDEILTQDYMKNNPTPSVNELSPPSFMDNIGKLATSDTIKSLIKLLSLPVGAATIGAGIAPTDERSKGQHSESEDWITKLLTRGPGVGKTGRALLSGDVEPLFTGTSFMPINKEIASYGQGPDVYYTIPKQKK